jgi:hypothetical protein
MNGRERTKDQRAEGPFPESPPSHAVRDAVFHEQVNSHSTDPLEEEPPSRDRVHQQKSPPKRGPPWTACPHSEAHKPLNRKNTCPRWDSNRTPAPANTKLPGKHAESGPIRPQYDPVRSPRCAQCAHQNVDSLRTPKRQPRSPTEGTRFFFALGLRTGSTVLCCARRPYEGRSMHSRRSPPN